jgi:hypothetical protein
MFDHDKSKSLLCHRLKIKIPAWAKIHINTSQGGGGHLGYQIPGHVSVKQL